MKTKFLCYSRSNPNQVVWHYAELEKVGEGVYTYLQQKDQYREEDDMIAIVLQLEDVFFEYGTQCRRFLDDKEVAAAGTEVLKIFIGPLNRSCRKDGICHSSSCGFMKNWASMRHL